MPATWPRSPRRCRAHRVRLRLQHQDRAAARSDARSLRVCADRHQRCALRDAQTRIEARFPGSTCCPCGRLLAPVALGGRHRRAPAARLLSRARPSATSPRTRRELLANMRAILGDGGRLIIGADLKKDVRRSARRLRRRGRRHRGVQPQSLAPRQPRAGRPTSMSTAFAHAASYDVRHGRIDMHLVSRAEQSVTVLGHRFRFAPGERIHTEHSHKYDVDGFQALAGAPAGRRRSCGPMPSACSACTSWSCVRCHTGACPRYLEIHERRSERHAGSR